MLASAGLMNPQIRFGEDLMSRVSYVMMNPGGEVEMTARRARGDRDAAPRRSPSEAGIDPRDILEMTVVGNPIMHHLLLGIDPTELGGAPFALATDEAIDALRRASSTSPSHPDARVYVLPCIAGHVGADTAGVILSETPHLADEMTLIVDVGTNAEIVLGNRHRLLAASSPTGPAFEGAQISCGQRAAPGAIERVRIDRATLEPRFKVIGCDLWSDEPGFAEATARERRHRHLRLRHHRGARRDVPRRHHHAPTARSTARMAARSARIQPDGRTFSYLLREGEPELAHHPERRARDPARQGGALCRRAPADGPLGVEQRRPDHARRRLRQPHRREVRDGAGPDPRLRSRQGRARPATPPAPAPASRSSTARRAREIEEVVKRIEKIETAVEPRFQEHFVDAMAIPHKTDPYPHLAP